MLPALSLLPLAAAIPAFFGGEANAQFPQPLVVANFSSSGGCDPTHGTTQLELLGNNYTCTTISDVGFPVTSVKVLNYEIPGCSAVFFTNPTCKGDNAGSYGPLDQCIQASTPFESFLVHCPAQC